MEACQHGTHPSFRARINIIGHSGAGKTSLTRRLLGKEFVEKHDSTDGIETHRIEFDLDESPFNSQEWSETELKTEQLSEQFNVEVLQKRDELFSKAASLPAVEAQEVEKHKCAPQDLEKGTQKKEQTRTLPETESETVKPRNARKLSKNSLVQQTKENDSQERTEVGLRQELLDQLKSITDSKAATVEEKPADTNKGVLRLWDFGGQTEFYATHHMFLDSDAINIIVMDVSKPLKSKVSTEGTKQKIGIPSTQEEFLCYWMRSIEAKANEKRKKHDRAMKGKPNIILVFTHTDLITCEQTSQFLQDVKETMKRFKLPEVADDHMFFVDNKAGSEKAFNELKKQLQQIVHKLPTWGMQRPVTWLKVEADMRQKLSGKAEQHMEFEQVRELAAEYHMTAEEVESFLQFLSAMGDIVWFPDQGLRHLITLNSQWMVDIFRALITAEEFMAQRFTSGKEFKENSKLIGEVLQLIDTGIVTYSSLCALWQGQDVAFLIELLQKFDLLLKLGQRSGAKRRFVVPSMLPPERQGECYKVQFSQNLSMTFRSTHTSEFDELYPLDTFPRLVATCAKIWPIREDGLLCFRHVSFTITEGVVLSLTQSHRSTILVTIWFSPLQHKVNPMHIVLRTRATLTQLLEKCKMPPSSAADIICPHWTLKDSHVSLVEVTMKMGKKGQVKVKAMRTECPCHSSPLKKHDFTKPPQSVAADTMEKPIKVRNNHSSVNLALSFNSDEITLLLAGSGSSKCVCSCGNKPLLFSDFNMCVDHNQCGQLGKNKQTNL